jgi:TctA family transporter
MYTIYFWLAVPILVATGAVMLFLRPIYVISSCDIYADYVQELQENLMLPPPPAQARGGSAIAVLIILALAVMGLVIFRYELGIMEMLAR